MAQKHTHVTRGMFIQAVQSEDGKQYTVTRHNGETETMDAARFEAHYEPIAIQPAQSADSQASKPATPPVPAK